MICRILLKIGGGDVEVSPDEYLDMPVQERVDLLLTNKIQFLNENGGLTDRTVNFLTAGEGEKFVSDSVVFAREGGETPYAPGE